MSLKQHITKAQDSDGHWYWIPNGLLHKFRIETEYLASLGYMDDPETFDAFSEKFEKFRTLGDPSLTPEFFKPFKWSEIEDAHSDINSDL